MAIRTEKYSSAKLERIKRILTSNADNGNPKDFELHIDELRVVDRTDDIDLFDTYEDFIDADTEQISVLIFNGASPRCDKYHFYLKNLTSEEDGLNGIQVDQRIEEKLASEKQKWEMDKIVQQNKDLENTIDEKDKEIDELKETIHYMETHKFHLGNLNLGELSSVVLEGFIRRNPQLLSKLPGGEALAGVIEADNNESSAPTTNSDSHEEEVTVEMASESNDLSEEEKAHLAFVGQMQHRFTQTELMQVMEALDLLADQKEQIPIVLNQLKTSNQPQS